MNKIFNFFRGNKKPTTTNIPSIFFGANPEETKQRFAELKEHLVPLLLDIAKASNDARRAARDIDGDYDALYDFHKGYRSGMLDRWDDQRIVPPTLAGAEPREELTAPIHVKPIDVLHELETLPHDPVKLEQLDHTIAMLKAKGGLTAHTFVKEQLEAMVERLENRKHYLTYREFFSHFPNTDSEKIENLVATHRLTFETADLFIPAFPDEAISLMNDYREIMSQFTSKIRVFYVIAEQSDFAERNKQLDPILLVQSPFGFWWQIIGAWDKELILLSEL